MINLLFSLNLFPLYLFVSSTDFPTVTTSHDSYSQTTGSTTFLECSVTATPRATRVFWQKFNNTRFTNVTIGGSRFNGANLNFPSLEIANSQISDSGILVYRCGATNSEGTSYSTHVILSVRESECLQTTTKYLVYYHIKIQKHFINMKIYDPQCLCSDLTRGGKS